MPVRPRKSTELAQQLVPLILLGIGLVSTNNSLTFLDRESTILGAASSPLRNMWGMFFSGAGNAGQPPLYEILLHFWLRGTNGAFDYVRIPSVLFFLAGLFLLGRASRYFTGSSIAAVAVIWVGVLWPFGFFFGRVAASDSFSFFLAAGLTLSYFKYLENQTYGRWTICFLFGVSLVWTSYFGWAILACLAIDQILRARAKELAAPPKVLFGTAVLLCIFFFPLFSAFRSTLSSLANLHQGALAILTSAGFHVFSLFVSEAVAPWYWLLSVPAGLAILFCVALALWCLPAPARRFLYYSAGILAVMSLVGVLQTRDLLLLSPWILLPVGVAMDMTKPRWATLALAAALLVIGGIGWYGIYSRRYFSNPQFLEPWRDVAADAAGKIGVGAKVIADDSSFLLYLTYFLHVPSENGTWRFQGLLPDAVRHPQVYSPAGWLAAGHPTSGKMILIRGANDPTVSAPLDEAQRQLDQSCGSISSRLRMRDEGYKWKQRFSPQVGRAPWGIEVREYDCDSSNSKQIYRIPPQ